MPALAGTSGIAVPLLVYTDLLLSGRDLNRELVQQLRRRYLAHLAQLAITRVLLVTRLLCR
jgi:hypothetical protein